MMSKIPLIAFFGPDGSGKSTITDLIDKRLAADGKVVLRYHWRPRALPSLRKDYSTLSFNDPNALTPRGYFVSFWCYVYFFFDFLIAQWALFRETKNRDSIILYERYYFDILFHPRRYQLTSIDWLGSFLSRFLRKPDITFVLVGTPQEIHKRKPELQVPEIERQIKLMSEKLPKLCTTAVIDTDKNDAAGVSEEIAIILSDNGYGIN